MSASSSPVKGRAGPTCTRWRNRWESAAALRFAGRLSEDALTRHLGQCRAVCFVPLREDYGFVTVEAFASGKAVVTCSDSGGPAELVRHDDSGFVCEPTPSALGGALARLMDDRGLAERLGPRGAGPGRGHDLADAVKRLVIV